MLGNFIVLTRKNIFRGILSILVIGVIIYCIGFWRYSEILETSNSKRLLPIYSVETKENKVSLTFDCAWGADDIGDIIDVLNKNDVRATFFTVGDWVTKNKEAVVNLHSAGMEIRESYFKSQSCRTNDI